MNSARIDGFASLISRARPHSLATHGPLLDAGGTSLRIQGALRPFKHCKRRIRVQIMRLFVRLNKKRIGEIWYLSDGVTYPSCVGFIVVHLQKVQDICGEKLWVVLESFSFSFILGLLRCLASASQDRHRPTSHHVVCIACKITLFFYFCLSVCLELSPPGFVRIRHLVLQGQIVRAHKCAFCSFEKRHWSLLHALSKCHLVALLFFNLIALLILSVSRLSHVLIGRMIATAQVSCAALRMIHASLLIEGNRLGSHLGVQIGSWSLIVKPRSVCPVETTLGSPAKALEVHIVFVALLSFLLFVLAFDLSG